MIDKKYIGAISHNREVITIDLIEFIENCQGIDNYIVDCDYYFESNSKNQIIAELLQYAIDNVSLADDTERQAKLLAEDEKVFEMEISFNRDKEDNWEVIDKAEELNFEDSSIENIRYLGYELNIKIRITDDYIKIIEIEGKSIDDKDIYI